MDRKCLVVNVFFDFSRAGSVLRIGLACAPPSSPGDPEAHVRILRRLEELRRRDRRDRRRAARPADAARAAWSSRSAASAGQRSASRPGREADHPPAGCHAHSGLPPPTLVRMWRELLAGTTATAGRRSRSRSIAPDAQPAFGTWRATISAARRRCGLRYAGAGDPQVTDGTGRGRRAADAAETTTTDPWWRTCCRGTTRPHVVARLPFCGARQRPRATTVEALVIGAHEPDQTGRDRTLLGLETARDVSRGRLTDRWTRPGLTAHLPELVLRHDRGGPSLILVEVDGFLIAIDRPERCRRFGPPWATSSCASADRRFAVPRAPPDIPRRSLYQVIVRSMTAPAPASGNPRHLALCRRRVRRSPGVERPIRCPPTRARSGPSPKALAAYRALAGELHRYPDGDAAELRQAIGAALRLDPARIVCGAGSDELIGLLCAPMPGPATRCSTAGTAF